MIQVLQSCQKTGTLAFGRDRTGRAAQIQIHFGISQFLHPLRAPDKIGSLAAHNLRDHRQSPVIGRIQFPEISGCNGMVIRGGKERNKISVRTAKMLIPHLAENNLGNTVQGCKIIPFNHFSFSSHSC